MANLSQPTFGVIVGVIACTVMPLSGCWHQQRSQVIAHSPIEPNERLHGRLIYPARPVWLDEKSFHQTLTQLADQVTLVYVIGVDGDYRQADLACLDETYRMFYRYGTQVLLIDLHGPDHWRELTNRLGALKSSLAAAMFDRDDLDAIKTFLCCDTWRDRQLFLVDPARSLVRSIKLDSCLKLQRNVRFYLQNRSVESHVLN